MLCIRDTIHFLAKAHANMKMYYALGTQYIFLAKAHANMKMYYALGTQYIFLAKAHANMIQ